MFTNKYPIFKKGSVLDKEIFELLRDNPLQILSLNYLTKKDGIINGFDLVTNSESKTVKITKGIAKCDGEIFWMIEDYVFQMHEEVESYILKLKLNSEIENKRFYERHGEFILEKGENINQNEIEITRFITRIGAELRNDYQNYNDLRRDFNLLEIINTKYSSTHELGTLHPLILKLWALDAIKKDNLDIYDVNFYSDCFRGNVEREIIIAYINLKLNLQRMDYTNEELFEYLKNILKELGNERKPFERKRIIPKKLTIE